MKLRFLGTGWSHGVPAIGCDCEVCRGKHPRNLRRRASVQLMDETVSVVVDVGPDFRDQALTYAIQTLDAVFVTHQHADHVMGLDDIRRFSWLRGEPLPVWAEQSVLRRLQELYPYAGTGLHAGKGVPLIDFSDWTGTVTVGGMRFTPFRVPHGGIPCLGLRIDGPGGSFGYVPDCSGLPAEALSVLKGVDVMILNALRVTPHPAHLSLAQSLGYLEKVGAGESYLTHMGCPLDYARVNPDLPAGVEMAWDGLTLER